MTTPAYCLPADVRAEFEAIEALLTRNPWQACDCRACQGR